MAANLIINGDFEATRVPNPQTQNYLIEHKPYGWDLTTGNGVDLLNDVHAKFGAIKTPYGQYVELDGRSNTGIKQAISTQIGSRYKLSFDWALPSYSDGKYSFPDPSSKFDVAVNGSVIFSYDGSYGVRNAWTHQDIGFTATANTTEISFVEKGVSDAEGTLLDNISVSVESQTSRVILAGNTGKGTDLPLGDTTAIQLDDGTLVVLAFKDPQLVAAPYGGGDVLGKGLIRFLDPQTGITTKPDIILGTGKTFVSGIEKTPDNGFIVFGQAKESLYGKAFGGATDAFVVKYKADGTFQWIQSYNTSLHESVASASVDPSGKILISGRASYDLSEPRNFGSQSWYGQALGGRYYAAFTSSISAQGTIDWVNVYGGLSGGIGVVADKNGYVSSIYTGVNSTPTNYSYFDYSNNLKWSKNTNVNDYASAMDVFYGQGIIAIVSSSNQVSLVNESGNILKVISAPNGGTVHDIEVSGDKLFMLSRSGSTIDLVITVYDKTGAQQGVAVFIPDSAAFVDKYGFEYDLEVLADGKYLIGGNTGDAGFAGAVIGDYREYILFDPNPKPVVRGNSIYTIVDGPSWTQAEANSVKLGGHLISIGSDQENNFIHKEFSITGNWSDPNSPCYLIGLTDRELEGVWKWSNGEEASYINWIPDGITPNGGRNENYVHLGRVQGGYWNDDEDIDPRNLGGISEIPFIRRGDSAYVIVQGPTWEEAEANAVKLGGHLVTINDAAENEWISNQNWKENGKSIWIGASDKEQEGVWKWSDGSNFDFANWGNSAPNGGVADEDYAQIPFGGEWNGKVWNDDYNGDTRFGFVTNYGIAEIKLAPNSTPTGTPNLSGTTKVGQVISIDKTPIQDADNFTGYTPTYNYSFEVSNDSGTTWTKLTSTDATDNNSTFTLTTAEVGKKVRGVVSYLDGYGTNESVASAGSSVISAPVVRGNSIYTIVDGPSWTQAEANSVKLGGHLAAITNIDENKWITDVFDSLIPTDEGLWIGLSHDNSTSKWKWSDGEGFNYNSWYPGEPSRTLQNDGVAREDSVHIYLTNQDGSGYHGRRGYWNDIPFNAPIAPEGKGISETPFIRRGDSAYVIVQGPTWEEAEANAVKLGGHLVTINDAAENEWLTKNMQWKPNGYSRLAYWIGLNDVSNEGDYKWISGEAANWRPPVWASDVGGEDYFSLIYFDNNNPVLGNWNDLTNSGTGVAWGMNAGIAEIKLAPNNAPTGTPTLFGTLKAGQIITIDKTQVQDADNFNGYTPTFNYSFEVSSDNGTTWTKLTSTDATDNNTTYTLTTAEVGKQVRGVVSYLDGYGTQESVASTASAPITSGAPPVQSLTLTPPSKTSIRSGISTTSAIAYNVSTGETSLTGVGASLYFDSTQLTVSTAGDPFQKGLIGNGIVADTNNADGDPKTDKILALTYADFGGNFPGSGTTLPLTLANLNLVPTASYTGTTLHLKGSPATGFTATGADLTLGYNAAPVVNGTLAALTTNRGRAFSYTVPTTLFSDSDSALTFSATTATGASLPSWLSFNASTRTLSGTPTTGGTLNLNLSASDELGSVSTPLTLKVREVQQLSSSTAPIRYQRNKDLIVPINYSTTDGSQTTGMSFKVHYNSSLFSFDPVTGVSNKATADLFQIGSVQQDTDDTDNDPTTDRFIPISIASFSGQFPSGSAPTKLADLTFRTADKAIDPLTGLRDTSINFSESSVASGYGFSGTSATLKPLSFSLDVDGDGLVTPLGDGLMVIRYLFGSAFAGDALINKAISPDSPLLGGKSYTSMSATEKAGVAAQVATNIQQGIDSQLLDVDKDGKITPLGDGLMVIRRLFGSAFEGSALTSKAISPESPYFGPPADFAAVAANIDALKPTMSVM